MVVAVGGGSVIDLAKAAAMLLTNGDPMDHLEVVGRGQPFTNPPLPMIAVPTTAGTGAEVTANAVLAVPEHGVKASLRHPSMIPRHALVDPELTLDCPPAVTASAGMDALTQCVEPYVSDARECDDRQLGADGHDRGWAQPRGRAPGRLRTATHARTWRCAACSAGCRWPTRSWAPCTVSPA